jgi:hypothetical protein
MAKVGSTQCLRRLPSESPPRCAGSLAALVAEIRGEKAPDVSLDHELTVQEIVARAYGILRRGLLYKELMWPSIGQALGVLALHSGSAASA